MRPERLLPLILVIAGAAAFFSIYQKKTHAIPVPPAWRDQPAVKLFYQNDCVTCHTVTALPDARGTLGPGLDDVGNRARSLSKTGDGKDYLRDSILNPGKVVRSGFVNAMPSFADKLDRQQVEQLVDWLSEQRAGSATPPPKPSSL